ncbi:MAG TPA: hypothetical protein VK980_15940 [Sphingomonas sp.]|nr:hypothetical protein [Sphingomonas sp.]
MTMAVRTMAWLALGSGLTWTLVIPVWVVAHLIFMPHTHPDYTSAALTNGIVISSIALATLAVFLIKRVTRGTN